jgi:hypothetical protein
MSDVSMPRSKRYYFTVNERRTRMQVKIFEHTMESYLRIKSVIGSPQCMNYENHGLGGSPKQFGRVSPREYALIEFIADCDFCAKQTLPQSEWESFYRPLLHYPTLNLIHRSAACLLAQAKLGAAFKSRNIWPVQSYMNGNVNGKNWTSQGRTMPGKLDLLQVLRATLQ